VRIPTDAPVDDLHPDGGGGIVPYPAGGDGYSIHDGGKGSISVKQKAGGVVSFSLDVDAGLLMNSLNGTSITSDVDTGEGAENRLALTPTDWQDVWVTIQAGGSGTHLVTVYLNGDTTPAGTFDVTAGSGSDYDLGYIGMGEGSTGESGALDVDYLRIAAGAQAPQAPVPPDELVGAFIFGSRDLTCETPNQPGTDYEMLLHVNSCDGHNALAYGYDDPADDPDLGPQPYGFVPLTPGNTDRNCSRQFSQADEAYGRFDESPNNRGKVGDDCPEQIYDSFIGDKSHTQPCNETVVGNAIDPCTPDTRVVYRDINGDTVVDELDAEFYVPNGIVFRADVPNGLYRFVGIFGDIDNPHAHHIIAEDGGGDSPPADETGWLIGPNHVELVHNFSQRRAGGDLHMAAVGFDDKLPPMDFDGGADPILHFMDEKGLETACAPNSPVLEVTQGHIRIHVLQGSRPGGAGEKDDGGDIVLLELWKVASADIPTTPTTKISRSFDQGKYVPGEPLAVTLTVSDFDVGVTAVETFPEGWSVYDAGGGSISDNTISWDVIGDGVIQYALTPAGEPNPGVFSGEFGVGCSIGGESAIAQEPFQCVPGPDDQPPNLMAAFAFGSRNLTVPLYSDPSLDYTMVHHAGNNCDVHNSLAYGYDPGDGYGPRPYGFEVIDPGNTNRNCSEQFGPFDDSPNNRNSFADNIYEEVYDSFIGLKNYTFPCGSNSGGVGLPEGSGMENFPGDPCPLVITPDTCADPPADYCPFPTEGAIWRVDVPNGVYRFVAVVGEADNPHANRLLAEDGGSGPPPVSGNFVTLVYNHDQAQWDIGEARGDCLGCGVFARVGFNCRVGPTGDGVAPDPKFINMGPDGMPLPPGDDGVYGTPDDPPPESPELVVTQGYIRFHLLQGNSSDGPGGKGRPGDAPPDWIGGRDPNGTDIVLLEVWHVGGGQIAGDCDQSGVLDISDVICLVKKLFAGFFLLDQTPPPPVCGTDAGELAVLDVNASGGLDISDIVYLANFLFMGGPQPVQGTNCFPLRAEWDCPDNVSCSP
jgi:hypothetical protein